MYIELGYPNIHYLLLIKKPPIVGNLLANSRLSPYFLHKGSSLMIIKAADD